MYSAPALGNARFEIQWFRFPPLLLPPLFRLESCLAGCQAPGLQLQKLRWSCSNGLRLIRWVDQGMLARASEDTNICALSKHFSGLVVEY